MELKDIENNSKTQAASARQAAVQTAQVAMPAHQSAQAAQPVQSAQPAKNQRSSGDSKKKKDGGLAEAFKEGNVWSIRIRRDGFDIYLTGYENKSEAEIAGVDELTKRREKGAPFRNGPKGTTLARAMYDYALKKLPKKKGADQEARRINRYLRAAGMLVLTVEKLDGSGDYFKVDVKEEKERVIPNGLTQHRRKLETKTADSQGLRAVLATQKLRDITSIHIQDFLDQMIAEGLAPATVAQERALIRAVFNYAKNRWKWNLQENPARGLDLPKLENKRDRVMTLEEQKQLDAAFTDCRNRLIKPVTTLLLETAMRTSEPLEYATWGDVDWERRIIKLQDSKTDKKRDVPLSPVAIRALKEIGPGEPNAKIVKITYEAIKASWKRVCKRAGVENLNLHDLRHTSATRMALKTGNLFLVKALTGHETLKMVERYVHVKAEDVVGVMHAPGWDELPTQGMPKDHQQAAMAEMAAEKAAEKATEKLAALLAKAVAEHAKAQPETPAPATNITGQVIDLAAARGGRA